MEVSLQNVLLVLSCVVLISALLCDSFPTVIRNDGVYHIMVDQVPFFKGNLLEDLEPTINPPAEIDDSNDKMPSDWDEREK